MPLFTDTTLFPTFDSLPRTTESVDPERADWCLVGQVKNNMTITKPTLIVTDRSGAEFAVTFEDRGFDLKARNLKKGNTIVIPRARRTPKGEGKQDALVVEAKHCPTVKAITAKLDRVLELGVLLEDPASVEKCAGCDKSEADLMKCTGCGSVVYCGKDCQVKGWGELGHKSDCKVFKGIKEVWG